MSIFPASGPARGRRPVTPEPAVRLETEGRLEQPLGGEIYLIEEADLEELWAARSHTSGLVSRH